MSDGATTSEFENDRRDRAASPLTPAAVDAILADFREWLFNLPSEEREANADRSPEPVDLFALVGQFTALRHEVNMQTRAARTAVEQNADVLKQLAAQQPAESGDELRPIAKAIVDIADALALSHQQLEKFRDTAEPLLQDLNETQVPNRSLGFFARMFGSRTSDAAEPVMNPNFERLAQLVAAASDGYAMSLRRVERLLPLLDLEAQSCVGEAFDPETMEAVEVVGDTEQPAGTVIEDVRPGYLWRGKVFRFAQVKVAR